VFIQCCHCSRLGFRILEYTENVWDIDSILRFLQRTAKLALQAAECCDKSVCLSVCPSARHTPVLCENEGTQTDAVFTIDR